MLLQVCSGANISTGYFDAVTTDHLQRRDGNLHVKHGKPDYQVWDEQMLLKVNRGSMTAGLPAPYPDNMEPPAYMYEAFGYK